MKIKTSELTGIALDWAVGIASEWVVSNYVMLSPWWGTKEEDGTFNLKEKVSDFHPSSDWSQGGPIIEREVIEIYGYGGWVNERVSPEGWGAVIDYEHLYHHVPEMNDSPRYEGKTPLIAAMRCYVSYRLGDTVEVPNELA